MVFSLTVDTPANTLDTKPQIKSMKLFLGLIYHVEVYFPPGPSGLLGVQLQAGGHQLYPYNRGSWFVGDDVLFKYDDLEHFTISTAQLDIYTYNNDTVFDHECLINIGIVTDEQFQQALAPSTSMTSLVDAINNLTSVITKQLPSGQKSGGQLLSSLAGSGS